MGARARRRRGGAVPRADGVGAGFLAGWRSFVRRRTAVFFAFLFPVILIVVFGALVRTGSGGLFSEPPAYYVPGYLAVVVVFTPLSRVSSAVARHREGHRFEKLATTPITRAEWLLAHTLVNAVLVGIAGVLVLALVLLLTGAGFALSPLLVPFVALGAALFCGIGALLGRLADSRDGAVAASNAIGLPLLFLSETFVPPELLPAWLPTWLSPLTYFSRGVRAAVTGDGAVLVPLAVLALCAVLSFGVGATLLPRTD
jgi:ABC-2 type transport system permease protein